MAQVGVKMGQNEVHKVINLDTLLSVKWASLVECGCQLGHLHLESFRSYCQGQSCVQTPRATEKLWPHIFELGAQLSSITE